MCVIIWLFLFRIDFNAGIFMHSEQCAEFFVLLHYDLILLMQVFNISTGVDCILWFAFRFARATDIWMWTRFWKEMIG